MNKNLSYFALLSAAIVALSFNLHGKANASNASLVCKVTDPTGTPLNVRNRPNGKVINSLRNGKDINILEIARDDRGRSWAKIGGYHNSEYREWGWVIREFVSCYET